MTSVLSFAEFCTGYKAPVAETEICVASLQWQLRMLTQKLMMQPRRSQTRLLRRTVKLYRRENGRPTSVRSIHGFEVSFSLPSPFLFDFFLGAHPINSPCNLSQKLPLIPCLVAILTHNGGGQER